MEDSIGAIPRVKRGPKNFYVLQLQCPRPEYTPKFLQEHLRHLERFLW